MVTASLPARRNTAVLVGFTAITNLADGVAKVTLPLLALRITGSPALVAGIGFTLTLPWLLIALHVGVLVDRLDRRRLVVMADALRVVAISVLLGAALTGTLSLPLLYAAGLTLGVAEVVALTALAALVPAALPRDRLERVNGWVAAAETIANEFAGPALGGLLVALGAGVALGGTAAAYVVGVLLLMLLAGRFRVERATSTSTSASTSSAAGTVNADIREGLGYLWSNRLLRTMAMILAVLAGSWAAWLAILPSYARDAHLGERHYGLLLSALGVGGLVGAFATPHVNRLLGRRWALFADLLGSTAMMAVPAMTTSVWWVGAAAFVGGIGGTLWTVNSRTIVMMAVPAELLGRFNAAWRLLGWGTQPLGALLAGVLAQVAGVRVAFAVFGVLAVAIIVPFLRAVTPGALTAIFSAPPAPVSAPPAPAPPPR